MPSQDGYSCHASRWFHQLRGARLRMPSPAGQLMKQSIGAPEMTRMHLDLKT
ncbi:MAG TPA: hypothetical protein VMT58_01200 [Candidatus Binataceae bacterium]|nr:hypothetical protein [Candidatus Binataceae bacterium]